MYSSLMTGRMIVKYWFDGTIAAKFVRLSRKRETEKRGGGGGTLGLNSPAAVGDGDVVRIGSTPASS